MSEIENNTEVTERVAELINSLVIGDDEDSGEVDHPEVVEENEEENELDADDEENDSEELPFPNLTIRIPSPQPEEADTEEADTEEADTEEVETDEADTEEVETEEGAATSLTPLYSPGTPTDDMIPYDIIEDMAAEAHALETEQEAFGEQNEEKVETKQEEKCPPSEKEPDSCSVCYIDLTTDNIVNTSCNHKFCNKCFFKWIKVQARCPMCRKHFRTDVDLTDEEITRESSEIYQDYILNLEKYVSISVLSNTELEKVTKLRNERASLIQSQISLREQIDQTRAYNDGVMAAVYEKQMMEVPRDIMLRYDINKRLPDYIYGYRKGLKHERERLEKIKSKSFNKKTKKKKRQLDLFNFGFNVENKVSKVSSGQKNDEQPFEFSFEFVQPDPNKPQTVFSFNS